MLSRWKLFDNLRRSLVPAALTLLLLLGWTVFPAPWFWTLAVVGVFLIPPVLAFLLDVVRKPDDMRLGQHLATVAHAAGRRFLQAGFALVSLPHEAYYSLDAVLRTLGRLLVTHRQLLEWDPSVDQETASRTRPRPSFRSMWLAPVLAAATAGWLAASMRPRWPCGPDPAPVAGLARRRLVDQPAPRPPPDPADGRADPLPRQDRPQDLGVLRGLRRRRGPLAATGQLPGEP